MMLPRINLGESGIRYFQRILKNGSHLETALIQLPIHAGPVWTWLPEAIDPQTIDLDGGWPEIHGPGQPMVEFVLSQLSEPNSVLVWDLGLYSPAVLAIYDAEKVKYFTVANSSSHEFIGEDRAYGYVDHSDAGKEQVLSLLRNRMPFGSLGVITTTGSSLFFDSQYSLPQLFHALAAHTTFLLASAYDDEGWIVWGPLVP